MKTGFIGGGNMARSIIGGLRQHDDGREILVSDPDSGTLDSLQADFSVSPCQDNCDLISRADVVVLAVKPQLMESVLVPLSSAYRQSRPLVISIAAGVVSDQILRWLDCPDAPCVRVMPNTPALVGTGASGLFAVNTDEDQRQAAQEIMNAVGISVWLETEAGIDAVTGVSGSGPAYFFYLMEAVCKAGINNGLDESVARDLTLQTALGAARLAVESGGDFETLRRQVTSPGGTTERALRILAGADFLSLVDQAVTGAAERSRELSREQG